MKISRKELRDILSKWQSEETELQVSITDGLASDRGFGVLLICRVVEITRERVVLKNQAGEINMFPFIRGTRYGYTEPRPSRKWSSTIWIDWACGSRCMIAEKKP